MVFVEVLLAELEVGAVVCVNRPFVALCYTDAVEPEGRRVVWGWKFGQTYVSCHPCVLSGPVSWWVHVKG